MDAEAFVVSLLDILPGREIRGRKRLQKLGFIAKALGAPLSARFYLHDFGPFSKEIASATDILTLVGEVAESDMPLGTTKKFVKVYKLTEEAHVSEPLPQYVSGAIRQLQDYFTVDLEIASTMLFFHREEGLSWPAAIVATKDMKPSKSVPSVIAKAKQALAQVGLYEGRGTNQVPSS